MSRRHTGGNVHVLRMAVLLCAALLSGCAGLRWEAPPRSGEAPAPAWALDRMSRSSPVRLQVVNSVLFEYRGRKMSGLGFLDVDVRTRSFGLTCMTPSGVTLFEVTGSNGAVRCRFALEAVKNREAFAETLGRDVARMFFDLRPPDGAFSDVEPGALVFSDTRGPDRLEWVVGGNGALLEKRYFEKQRLVCRIGYYAPLEQPRLWIPGRVCLQNLKNDYGLTVTIREVRRSE